MMKRTISLALLLACCGGVLAEPLYKWVEADGSITFSPTKPDNSIDFQLIDAGAGVTASKIAVREPELGKADAQVSEQFSDIQAIKLPPTSFTQSITTSITSASSAGTASGSDSLFFNRTSSNAGQQASFSSMFGQRTGQTHQTAAKLSPIAERQNECEDLRKRVVSLERRLKSTLTPEDMDNTVIHMSRYQRNYDEFCSQ